MDLQWLQDKGGLVPQDPVKREVAWTHDAEGEVVTDTVTVRIRKLSAGDVERMFAEAGKKPGRSYSATMIAECVLLGDEGDTRLTYEQAFQLDPSLAEALLTDAVHEVNPLNRPRASAKN